MGIVFVRSLFGGSASASASASSGGVLVVAAEGLGRDTPIVAYFLETCEEGGMLFGECSSRPGGQNENDQGWWEGNVLLSCRFISIIIISIISISIIIFVVEKFIPPIKFVDGTHLDSSGGSWRMLDEFGESVVEGSGKVFASSSGGGVGDGDCVLCLDSRQGRFG